MKFSKKSGNELKLLISAYYIFKKHIFMIGGNFYRRFFFLFFFCSVNGQMVANEHTFGVVVLSL